MIDVGKIEELVNRIAEGFHPQKVILFGSYARGNANEDSDVDLLVVMNFKGLGIRKTLEIRKTVEPGFSVDILVRTPRDIQRRLKYRDLFIEEIMETGKVLYESRH
jgi:uncharacterized protein